MLQVQAAIRLVNATTLKKRQLRYILDEISFRRVSSTPLDDAKQKASLDIDSPLNMMARATLS